MAAWSRTAAAISSAPPNLAAPCGDGTAFELAHEQSTITALASFTGSRRCEPYAGLIEDTSGNFFGSSQSGGTSGTGTVFELDTVAPTVTMTAPANNSSTNNTGRRFPPAPPITRAAWAWPACSFSTARNGGINWTNAGPARDQRPVQLHRAAAPWPTRPTRPAPLPPTTPATPPLPPPLPSRSSPMCWPSTESAPARQTCPASSSRLSSAKTSPA